MSNSSKTVKRVYRKTNDSTDLSRARIHHGGGEDGEDCVIGIQDTLLKYGVVLFDSHREGDVILLSPPP